MTTKATLGPRMGPFATDAFGGSTTPCREWPENERYGKGWNGKTVTISRASFVCYRNFNGYRAP